MRSGIFNWVLIFFGSVGLIVAALPAHRVLAGSDAEKRGQELFASKGCVYCHGPNGVGGGRGPDLQLVRQRRSRQSMILQIRDGGKEMPPFGGELSAQEIDELVTFLRAKRKLVVVTPGHTETPDSPGSATN